MKKNALQAYRCFLATIPLGRYRDELKDVKWVEQDLYEELLPLKSIYFNYWDQRDAYPDFETWFEGFWGELHSSSISVEALQRFKKYYFDKDDNGWFKLGFKARMWRTWVSLLTQLDFCYMVEHICHKQNLAVTLQTNAELDKKGIDLRVGEINFQIKKITERKEARQRPGSKRKEVIIPYPVYNLQEYERKAQSPRVSCAARTAYRNALQAFHKYFECLPNGFVVFGERLVEQIVKDINDYEKLKTTVDALQSELKGD